MIHTDGIATICNTTIELESPAERLELPDDTPPMTHLVDPIRGFPWAVCGTKGSIELGSDMAPADCVVCEELWNERYGMYT